MEKYCRAGQATDVNMAHAHCMLDTRGYKNKLIIFNTYSFSSATMVARTRLRVTLHVHCLLFIAWVDPKICRSPRPCLSFRNMSIFFYNVKLLALPPQTQRWRSTSCRLSAATYFIYWQLHCISRGRLLHLRLSDALYGGSSDPITMAR